MIIFDLACLANDEHRRHFIEKPWDCCNKCYIMLKAAYEYPEGCECGRNPFTWQEDYQAYNEACGGDKVIKPVSRTALSLIFDIDTQIWSSQCISAKEIMVKWITDNIADISYMNQSWLDKLKMRPIDDNTPQEELFEGWLDATIRNNQIVDFVFSSHKKTIEMFRKRRVFVFDCGQDI